MQKISRIYLGNCGYRTAWYDGVTLNLVNPADDAPTDTIINLENGGGKTTLLSLIFSTFEPHKSRFLKHIQNPNHHFVDYFNSDGTPGFVLVEWLIPGRTSSARPRRLVTGQAVSVSPSGSAGEPGEPQRLFFSFEEHGSLGFEDVPAPKLSMAPVSTMTELRQWLGAQQRRSGSDLYLCEKQSDWQQHLRSGLGIDVDMLRTQVNFSAQEGGFDNGFLDFKNEAGFLRKFLGLTIDEPRAKAVRDAVEATCDKQRKRPQYQAALSELGLLRVAMTEFDALSRNLRGHQASRFIAQAQGAEMAWALDARSVEAGHAADAKKRRADASMQAHTQARKDAAHCGQIVLAMRALQWSRAVAQAQSEHKAAQALMQNTQARVRAGKAAQLHARADAARQEIARLEADTLSARAGLAPFEASARAAADALRGGLRTRIRGLRTQLEHLALAQSARAEQAQAHAAHLQEIARQRDRLVAEASRLEAQESLCLDELQRLVQGGHLQEGQRASDVTSAAQAWQEASEASAAKADLAREHRAAALGQVAALRKELALARESLTTLRAQLSQQQAFVREGHALRSRICTAEPVRQVAQGAAADLTDPFLHRGLEELGVSLRRQISALDVELHAALAQKNAIEASGVAGADPDVDLVVAVLRDAGVRSAQPFKDYLSKAVPQADLARALVMQDPARFLGVTVAQAEMKAAGEVDWGARKPFLPVVISPNATSAVAEQDSAVSRLVVGPFTDAAYNAQAASTLESELQVKVEALQHRLDALRQRQTQVSESVSLINAFADKYGQGKLEHAEGQVEQLTLDLEGLSERCGKDEQAIEEAQAAAERHLQESQASDKQAAGEQRRSEELRRFAAQHGDTQQARQDRLSVIARERDALEQATAQTRGRMQALEEQARIEGKAEQGLRVEEQSLVAAVLDVRFDPAQDVSLAGPASDSSPEPRPGPQEDASAADSAEPALDLEALRSQYRSAISVFDAEEGTRLGVLRVSLEQRRAELQDAQRDIAASYTDVAPELIAQLREQVAGSTWQLLQAELEAAQQAAAVSHGQREQALRTALEQSSAWHQDNPEAQQLQLAELGLADVEQKTDSDVAQALQEHEQEQSRQFALSQQALEQAQAANLAAQELSHHAGADKSQAERLRDDLRLGAQPDIPTLYREAVRLGAPVANAPEVWPDLSSPTTALPQDVREAVAALLAQFRTHDDKLNQAHRAVTSAFVAVQRVAARSELKQVEPVLSHQLQNNDVDAAVQDSARLLAGLVDRMDATRASLEEMTADFDACLGEVLNLLSFGEGQLRSALGKQVPAGAPVVGGKAVLKMRAKLGNFSADDRRHRARAYLEELIEAGEVPASGADMVADVLRRLPPNGVLGLQVLKMVSDEGQQYADLDKITNSGGEGVVMAMFLYAVISQLRAEVMSSSTKAGGGPLLLDNPFAKATSPAMWKAQRSLAQAMGLQLIFTTAIQDFNALGEFESFIRLRKAGVNNKTQRQHLELAKHTFVLPQEPAEATSHA